MFGFQKTYSVREGKLNTMEYNGHLYLFNKYTQELHFQFPFQQNHVVNSYGVNCMFTKFKIVKPPSVQ